MSSALPGNEPTLTLNITTEMSEEEWVGIGFSDDRLMGRDDVVAVLKDPFRETFLAVSLLNPIRELLCQLHDTRFLSCKKIPSNILYCGSVRELRLL